MVTFRRANHECRADRAQMWSLREQIHRACRPLLPISPAEQRDHCSRPSETTSARLRYGVVARVLANPGRSHSFGLPKRTYGYPQLSYVDLGLCGEGRYRPSWRNNNSLIEFLRELHEHLRGRRSLVFRRAATVAEAAVGLPPRLTSLAVRGPSLVGSKPRLIAASTTNFAAAT